MMQVKNFYTICASLVCTTAISSAALVSHWKFDATAGTIAADETGAFPGTLSGSASWAPGLGISGGAISCVPTGNGFVTMGSSFPTFHGANHTLIGWMKSTSTSHLAICGKHWTGFFNGYFIGGGSGSGYGLPNKAYYYNGGSGGQSPVSTTTVNDGQWHQVVGVRVLNTAYIYVDGMLQNTRPANNSSPTTAAFVVGGLAFSGTPGNGFNGLIDEVQVYNEELCPEQIQYLYEHPGTDIAAPVNVTGTVGLQDYEGAVGGLSANVNFINCYGRVLQSTNAILSGSGAFSVSTNLRGSFIVSVKVGHWLRKAIPVVAISDSGATGLTYSLINGDAVDDNEVNLVDTGAIATAFGTAIGEPNWNPDADLNGDEEVTLVDYGIMSSRFGIAGDD